VGDGIRGVVLPVPEPPEPPCGVGVGKLDDPVPEPPEDRPGWAPELPDEGCADEPPLLPPEEVVPEDELLLVVPVPVPVSVLAVVLGLSKTLPRIAGSIIIWLMAHSMRLPFDRSRLMRI
jgi:hypothetical protein